MGMRRSERNHVPLIRAPADYERISCAADPGILKGRGGGSQGPRKGRSAGIFRLTNQKPRRRGGGLINKNISLMRRTFL